MKLVLTGSYGPHRKLLFPHEAIIPLEAMVAIIMWHVEPVIVCSSSVFSTDIPSNMVGDFPHCCYFQTFAKSATFVAVFDMMTLLICVILGLITFICLERGPFH